MKKGNITKKKLYSMYGEVNCCPLSRTQLWAEMHAGGADEVDFLLEFPGADVIETDMSYQTSNKAKYRGSSLIIAGPRMVRAHLNSHELGVDYRLVPMRFGDHNRMLYEGAGWINHEPQKSLPYMMARTISKSIPSQPTEEIEIKLLALNCWKPLRLSTIPRGEDMVGDIPVNTKVAAVLIERIEYLWRQTRPDSPERSNMSSVRNLIMHCLFKEHIWMRDVKWLMENGKTESLDIHKALLRGIKIAGDVLTDALTICDISGEFPDGQLGEVLKHYHRFQSI